MTTPHGSVHDHDANAASERWVRVQAAFHTALALPADARAASVAQAASGDEAFEATVLAMLAEDVSGDTLLDRGLARAAGAMLPMEGTDDTGAPSRIGPWRLGRRLGEGGMAVVYLAEREDLGNRAAVKLLHHGWMSPARRRLFVTEQRTLARLNHPHVAHLHDAGALPDGTPWIAMEYVDGAALTTYVKQHALPLRARLRLFRDVCEAVQHAHGHLVIHRDLKPSNILVSAAGEVKLLDFGIAKQLEADDDAGVQTRTGLRLLTPAYAAPEQLRAEACGLHTDVYALGVILHELLSGALPFALQGVDGTPEARAAGHVTPDRPSAAARGSADAVAATAAEWQDLDVLCAKAMQHDPGRRYRTVDALLRDIDHFLRNEPLEARPDSMRYRLGKFARRHRAALLGTAVAASLLIGVSALYAMRMRDARQQTLAEAERAQEIQRFTLSLFEGGESSSEPGDSLRAVSLVERGVVEAATLAATPVVQAELFQTLGGIFQKLGKLDRADTLLQRALIQRRALATNHPDVARSLVALGLLRVEQARLPEAEQLVREGLALSRTVRTAGHLDIAVATTALGRVLEERAAYSDAITVTREALRLHTALAPISPSVAAAATQLGNQYFYAGDYAGADSLFRRSRAVASALYGERHPLVADALINIGAVHYQRAEYAQAERYDRKGLAIIRRVYGANDPRTASALTMLGRALVAETRMAEAEPLVQEALAIRERVYGAVSPKVASTVNELGIMALRDKDYAAADAYFARNVNIYRTVYGGPHNLLATALANRGSVFAARGDHVGAERLYREALDVFGRTLPPTHLDIGIARAKLGRVLLRQGRYAAAERESAAGLTILLAQTSPATSWVRNARSDLAQMYQALGDAGRADAMRRAMADTVARH